MEKSKAERLVGRMKAKGIEVSIDQANSILGFLRMLADVVVANHLKNSKEILKTKINKNENC